MNYVYFLYGFYFLKKFCEQVLLLSVQKSYVNTNSYKYASTTVYSWPAATSVTNPKGFHVFLLLRTLS